MKRLFALLLALTLAVSLAGCGPRQRAEDGKLQVVCTVFPYYDFARQIGGDDVDVTLLVAAGKETHSFEPTPLDVITLSESDVFLYNGGESEAWVEDILSAAGENIAVTLPLMPQVSALAEEWAEGMEGGHDDTTMTMTVKITATTAMTLNTTSTCGRPPCWPRRCVRPSATRCVRPTPPIRRAINPG